jgi:hypothetical protein
VKKDREIKSRNKKHAAGKPQPDVVGAMERSISAIPTNSRAIETAASPKAISDAVKLAVENFLKTTFGTQDDELQNRFLMQAANIVPDFAVREEKTCEHIAAALRGVSPRDSLEGMLAVQMVATHTLALECMRRAAQGTQTDVGVELYINRATKLLRMFTSLTEALSRYRGKFEQKMTVEHVHVYQGGQAIVGQVSQNNNQVNQQTTGKK